MTNTYKVKVELTTLANSEEEARSNVSRIINPASMNGGSINKIDVDETYKDKGQNEQSKKQQSIYEKEAEKQFKDQEFLVESQVPDEIVIRDPSTGNSKMIKNPFKEKQLEEVRKKQGKSDDFNPQMNSQDAREFTGGQVDNKSEGGLTRGTSTVTEAEEAMYRKQTPSANKQKEASTSSTSNSSVSKDSNKETETGKTQVRKY